MLHVIDVNLARWFELEPSTLAAQLQQWGFPASHAPAILRAWHRNGGQLDDWTRNRIGPKLTALLNERVGGLRSTIAHKHQSADGTIKLLVKFPAASIPSIGNRQSTIGNQTECVLMPAYRAERAMACVSSQIGCAMGCDFCASTKNGLERDLSHGEIVEQFVHLQSEARAIGRRITSLVFMGMGEPMLNLDAVIPAIRIIANPDLGGVGWRQVTVSTVGIVPGIDRLADENLNVHLALSLHAADDETRSRIVPMNRKWPIDEILAAAARFYEKSGRIVTIEWCLIDGVNDSNEQADKLAALLVRFEMLRKAHVNVIPFNPIGPSVRGVNYSRPSPDRVKDFIERLQSHNIVCHKRDTRGDDVSAACGQLRRNAVVA